MSQFCNEFLNRASITMGCLFDFKIIIIYKHAHTTFEGLENVLFANMIDTVVRFLCINAR